MRTKWSLPTRRETLLRVCNGIGAMALAGTLAEDEARAASLDAVDPLKPRAQHHPRKAKHCIYLFMVGGVSQMDSFEHKPMLEVRKEEGRYLMKITQAASISHTLAAVALEMARARGRPPEIHFGWSEESPLEANLKFLILGQGNIPLLVHALLRHGEPNSARRPRVVVG